MNTVKLFNCRRYRGSDYAYNAKRDETSRHTYLRELAPFRRHDKWVRIRFTQTYTVMRQRRGTQSEGYVGVPAADLSEFGDPKAHVFTLWSKKNIYDMLNYLI